MKYFLLLIAVLFPGGSGINFQNKLIIWNVGQGTFITVLLPEACWHFDAGGESFPKRLQELCFNKNNMLFLSHDDWDHINGVGKMGRWPRVCVAGAPRRYFSWRKKKLLQSFPTCPRHSDVVQLTWPTRGKKSNDLSQVYFVPRWGLLFPGDSSRPEEKLWAPWLAGKKVRWWALGHHGSLTSTSKTFLENIGQPRGAFVSARWKVHGHPHPLVEARLRVFKIPVLRTEDWGHIVIEL